MKIKKIHKLYILFALIFIFLLCIAKVSAEEDTKHILIINSYNQGYKWTDEIVRGVNESLKTNNRDLFIDTEYMDSKRRYDKDYFLKLYEFYKYKYSDRKFDLIVCSDDDALNFMFNYGEKLFSDTPVVFCGINDLKENLLNNHRNYTGLVENPGYKETLDMALKLNPRIDRIAVLTDKTNTGSKNSENIRRLENQYKNIDFLYYDNMNIPYIQKELEKLPKKTSAVILMCTLEENYGKIIPLKEFYEIICKKSSVPVYSLWDFTLGSGVLGGMVSSGYYQGMEVGRIGKRILNGEKPSNIPIGKINTNKYMFDYNILKKLNYNINSLPKDCIIVNQPSTKYDVPKSYILYGLIVLIFISIIVNYVLIVNISRREKTEKLLRESEKQYRKLFELSPDAIFVDKGGIIKIANRASLKLFGVSSYEELIGKNLISFIPKEDVRDFLCYRTRVGEEYLEAPVREGKLVRKDGTALHVESVATFFPYKGENMILTVKRDITDRKKLIEALQYDKMKTDFFANISHELRTPLNVILSAIQLWDLYEREGKVPKMSKMYKYRNIMKQNCLRLLRLINNLIDITKIDANYLKANFQNYDIIRLVEDITMSVADYIENKNINLTFDTEIEEKVIACDVNKIERIMLNLLSNAVKFTNPHDSIFVNIYDRDENILISVKDTGIGIPKDKLQMIFERFKQVDKSLSRNKEGSGIGLSLVKSFVEMHDGSVYVKSKYGNGSEFIVQLPVRIVEDKNDDINYTRETKTDYVERINIEFSDIYE